jgi:hypothetical protein
VALGKRIRRENGQRFSPLLSVELLVQNRLKFVHVSVDHPIIGFALTWGEEGHYKGSNKE